MVPQFEFQPRTRKLVCGAKRSVALAATRKPVNRSGSTFTSTVALLGCVGAAPHRTASSRHVGRVSAHTGYASILPSESRRVRCPSSSATFASWVTMI